jgi:hypothetical protein
MGSFSDYLEKKLIDHTFGTAAYTAATSLYIALSTKTLTDTADGAALNGEVGTGATKGYARKKCKTWDASSATGGDTENTQVVTFATATASWGTVKTFAICDKLTKGNVIAYGTLTTSKTIGVGDTAKFATGAIDVTLA